MRVTGKLLWKFDSGIEGRGPQSRGRLLGRRARTAGSSPRSRSFVYALDAATGKPITGFGQGRPHRSARGPGPRARKQSMVLTTPGVIYKDLLIVGGRNPESLPGAAGRHPRLRCAHGQAALDRSTPFRIPASSAMTPGRRTRGRTSGAANNWAGMAVDQKRGHRLRADGIGGVRFLWRRPRGRRSVREYAAGARCRRRASASGISRR